MPTGFATHLNQEVRAPVGHSGVIQEVIRHVHHPEDLNDPRDASRDPSIERICDKRLSPGRRAWPYASSTVTPRPTFPCFLSSGVTGSYPGRNKRSPAAPADEIGNGRSRGRQNDSRASEPFLRGGQTARVERRVIVSTVAYSMARFLLFDISLPKRRAIGVSKAGQRIEF
jgi:hypothetical protein